MVAHSAQQAWFGFRISDFGFREEKRKEKEGKGVYHSEDNCVECGVDGEVSREREREQSL